MKLEMNFKDMWYWGTNFALLAMASLSMYLDNPIPMLAVAVPLCLLDRAYVIPLLLFIACIEGSFSSEDSSSQAESLAIIAIGPMFLWDFFKHNGVKVPLKISLLFLTFIIFVIWGIIIFKMNTHIVQFLMTLAGEEAFAGVTVKTIMKVLKLVFFFLYLKTLINKDKGLVFRGLTIMKDMVPYLLFCICLDMIMFGAVTSQFDTMHFGESKHGDFTANLDALGIFLYISIFEPKNSWFKRFVNIIVKVKITYVGHYIIFQSQLFMIMQLASRNGLLCFIILSCFGGLVGVWHKSWGFKFSMVVLAVMIGAVAFYFFKDSPTIERLIYYQEEREGGDRMAYWLGGAMALQEEPFFGLGGHEAASFYAVDKYSPDAEVEGHVMHNTFLEFAVEYGIIGVSFYLIFVFIILYHAWKNFFFALKYNEILLTVPSIAYFISIFAGLFVSRIWESTLWYNTLLVFAIYILWRMPVEKAMKKRKAYLIHGLPDPMNDPSLAIHVS